MRSMLKVIVAILFLPTVAWIDSQDACAGTIASIVANDNGKFSVGTFTFTFTDQSVSDNPAVTSDQITVAAVGTIGIEFTIDLGSGQGLRLDSMGDGVARNASIDIKYSVTSTRNIGGAGLDNNAFAQFKANGAYSQVTESLGNGSTLYKGSGATSQVNVLGANFTGVASLDVDNAGALYTPARGAGGNQDEAQLSSITNTFGVVPEPATIWLLITGGLLLLVRRCLIGTEPRLLDTSL
jgi:hypothetical protein